jgi:prepilin-type N-terminal cleavage/methylation domain-containing protein
MSQRGFTLLEMMMTVAIMTIVMGVLAGLSLGIGRTAGAQRAEIAAAEEARWAMETLVARVRSASELTINKSSLPGKVLRFRPATDTDGNGTAVDVNGRMELGPQIAVQPDTLDVNGDGVAARQLLLTQGGTTRVLCNSLRPAGAAPAIRGFWVAVRNGGLDITIETEARDNRGRRYRAALTEFVMPRN